MIQHSEARELCTNSEWELVDSSFSLMVEMFPPPGLKRRMERVRKLHAKPGKTTRRKTELFAETIGRFEAALSVYANAAVSDPDVKNVDDEKVAEVTRTLNMDGLRERADRKLESRKSHVQSAMALRGEQQGQKSGAKHIQSHVGSVTRRNQAKRDTKNR